MSENIERTEFPETPEKKPFLKCIPVMSLPAIIALIAMVVVFVLTFYTSFYTFNMLKGLWHSNYVGNKNYSMLFEVDRLTRVLGDTLTVKGLILVICGVLSAALCAFYRLFKKPGVVLFLACLWLIPVCLPTAFMSMETRSLLHYMGTIKEHSAQLFGTGLQTIGMFCFTGGIFTWLNLRKTGKAGKAPFTGLLTAVLIFLLGNLTTSGLYYGFGTIQSKPFDSIIPYTSDVLGKNFYTANASSVIKIAFQILFGLIPAVFLCRMSNQKGLTEETPKALWWLFPSAMVGILLVLFTGCKGSVEYPSVSVNSLIVSIASGAFGGLVAWSLIHLMKHSSPVLFGFIAVILSAAMSCINMFYLLYIHYVSHNDLLPQVLCSAFDWRVILLIITLAMTTRSHKMISSGFLALSMCLLIAAFAWGEYSNQVHMLNRSTATIPILYCQTWSITKRLSSMSCVPGLLMVVPPLLMGLGSALLMRKAFQKAEPRNGSSVLLSEPEAHSEIQA